MKWGSHEVGGSRYGGLFFFLRLDKNVIEKPGKES